MKRVDKEVGVPHDGTRRTEQGLGVRDIQRGGTMFSNRHATPFLASTQINSMRADSMAQPKAGEVLRLQPFKKGPSDDNKDKQRLQ